MFGVMLAYPFIALLVILIFRNRLDEENIKKRISNFYTQIKTDKGLWSLSYYTIFLLRRLLFVAIPTLLPSAPWFQLQILIFTSSLYVMYYAGTKPHAEKERVNIEIFNEIMIMMINYHMVCFSEFNLDLMAQFNMGYSFVVCILVVVFGNIMVLAIKQIKSWRRKKMLAKRVRMKVNEVREDKIKRISELVVKKKKVKKVKKVKKAKSVKKIKVKKLVKKTKVIKASTKLEKTFEELIKKFN
jgi:hypothetical protein